MDLNLSFLDSWMSDWQDNICILYRYNLQNSLVLREQLSSKGASLAKTGCLVEQTVEHSQETEKHVSSLIGRMKKKTGSLEANMTKRPVSSNA